MKKTSVMHKLLTGLVCLCVMFWMIPAVQVAAAEHVSAQTQTGDDRQGLILLLSAVAITGLVLLIAIRWGKKKFFEN